MLEVLKYSEIILQTYPVDETTSLAIAYGCLVGAYFIKVARRFDDWWWRRWKFKMTMRLYGF